MPIRIVTVKPDVQLLRFIYQKNVIIGECFHSKFKSTFKTLETVFMLFCLIYD